MNIEYGNRHVELGILNIAQIENRIDDFESRVEEIINHDGPYMCDVFMDPEQFFYPKLTPSIMEDGTIVSPPLEDLSPLLPRSELKNNMLIGIHEKSEKLIIK